MKSGLRKSLLAGVVAGFWSPVAPLCAQMPPAIVVSGEAIVATFHAEGAQLYECRLDLGNKLVWQVREPIAALILDGKTIGPSLCRPKLAARRRQLRAGQDGGRGTGGNLQRCPLAQTGCYRAARQRNPLSRENRPAHQHQGRRDARIV